ncbi:MAG: hypothetical protein VYE22_20905 [Myxococcota bacterium]|nr:hypothetical protein [Myxococcota bacterium]
MQRHVHLEVLDIAEPCAEDWDAMTGEGHRRHCGTCDRDVFDLSRLTADEAEALLASGACVRFYRRADGTVTTKDCTPDRLAAARAAARRSLKIAAAAIAGVLTLAGGLGAASLVGASEWVAEKLSPEPVMIMGAPPMEHVPVGEAEEGQ